MALQPIKRNEHIAPLSRDHHGGLLFCYRIRKGVKSGIDAKRISKYIQWYWQEDMQKHFLSEEKNLFIIPDDAQIKKALDEHVIIENKINTITTGSADSASLLDLAAIIDNHIRFEERELFPYLENSLSPEQLQKIGAILLKEEKESCALKYDDEFWRES